MKKIIFLLISLFIFFPTSIHAFSTSATSSILMDMDSGRILYSHDIHNVRSVASISKIMTAIVAIENADLEKVVTIGNEIDTAYGSGIYIKHGEQLTIKDLLYGLMLRSGNDAALAIAHHTSGSVEKFVEKMNEKAKEIGMKNSEFHNPSGLDIDGVGNFSTAYDMALLTSYAMKNEVYQQIVSTKHYSLKTNENVYSWTNKNKLLHNLDYITGGKTGFTEIARRTLVTTASRDGLHLVVVTLNDGNDFLDHQHLFEEAFSIFQSYKILKTGNIEILNETYYENATFELHNDFSYPLDETEKENVYLKIELEKKPHYQDGDVVGEIYVFLGDQEIYKDSLYIRKTEQKKMGFFEKIVRWFRNLW